MTLLANGRIYLDWNATSLICEPARKVFLDLIHEVGNPSSIHLEGRKGRIVVETSRDQIQESLGLVDGSLVFTSGATEAAALILHNADLSCSAIEHDCVKKWCNISIPVNKSGQVEKKENLKLDVLQIANSETGILQNIPKSLYCTDAAQAIGKVDCYFQELNPLTVIMSSHKTGGPKGVGAAFLQDEVKVTPLIRGGMQEMGYRAGTENFILIAAFSEAIKYSKKLLSDGIWENVRELRNFLENEIQSIAKEANIVGIKSDRLPNTSCIVTPGWSGENQVIELDLMGFSVSSGSACSSGKISASDTLVAMGFDKTNAKNGLRVSLGPRTKKSDIESFISAWKSLYIKHKENN